jgi:ABC-type multidrug transport system fused ATPase/permease subunit
MTTALQTTPQLRDLFRHLPHRRRWQGVIVLLLMLVGALAEVLTLGAILPFLALLANPQALAHLGWVSMLLGSVGLTTGPELLPVMAGLFCVVAILTGTIRIVLAWATQKYVFRIGYDLGVAVYRRILFQPYSYHVSKNSSEVIAAIGKVQSTLTGVLLPVMQGISSAVIALSLFIGLLFINATVALVSGLGFGLIYMAVSVATRARLRRNSGYISQAQGQRVQVVQEGVGGIRDVLIEHAQAIYVAKFAHIDTRLRDAQAANALIAAAPRFVIEGLGMVMIALLALALSRQAGGLMAAMPVLGALALGAQRMLPLLQVIYNAWSQYMGNQASYAAIISMLDHPIAPELLASQASVPLPFEQALELDDVSFAYGEGGAPVIRGISMAIPRGARIGLIGKTGSGKSTAMDLVMGLLHPTRGVIRVDGEALTLSNVHAWQAQIAHVPQHIYLSDATLIENIAFGVPRERIDEDRAWQAAGQADITDFIDDQPQGYETRVGERGVRLSGGQRQRIGIARALYKRSKLLVFDEATSALDDATEAAVMDSIYRLGRDLTVIMIAHRLTTLRGCDIIYRLEHGQIVASGTFAEMV